MPALGAADTKVKPAGSRSVTCTPVALLGPLLVAVMVKVTLVFWFGAVLLTVLVMAISAATAFRLALAELLAPTGSGWSSAVLVAVLVEPTAVLTVTVIVSVALALLARPPMFQMPLTELYAVPALATCET